MATGEANLFVEIWEELEPEDRVSFVSGHCLVDQHEMRSFYFAHVLSKGAFPKFRLYKKNIVLLNLHEHKLWDAGKDKIKSNPHLLKMWQKMFDLEDELKREYHDKNLSTTN
jgi:hypothetical protein